jgi:hypothetical protein
MLHGHKDPVIDRFLHSIDWVDFMASRTVVEAFKNFKHYVNENEREIKRKILQS